jgi:hypothetical protein
MSETNEASVQSVVIQRCDTCHWWTDVLGTIDGRAVCVWHTGLRDNKVRKVDFSGKKSMRTTADFGCVCWQLDERKSLDNKSIN